MATDLHPTTMTPNAAQIESGANQLWQLYGLMKRMTAHMTVLKGGEAGIDFLAIAEKYGYSDPAPAEELYTLLVLSAQYLQAETLPDGVTPNPVRLLMHKLG